MGYNLNDIRFKKTISVEGFVCIGVVIAIFTGLSVVMGFSNLLSTLFNNAYKQLMDTVLYITALAVVAGAFSAVLTEFGVIALANKFLSPLMKPLYGMPGATIIGIFTCYMSDNPAILTLTADKQFRCFYKKYQLPALCNVGTAFGMGLITTVTMLGLSSADKNFGVAVLIGNLAAIIGSIVSCRLMLIKTKKVYGKDAEAYDGDVKLTYDPLKERMIRPGSWGARLFDALLEGGADGVKIGVSIVPGVLIICNLVMILTGTKPDGGYTGAAGEGVGLIGMVGEALSFIITPLFGFTDPGNIAVPLTALGSAGAATGLVREWFLAGQATNIMGNDIAVFTAMCMCWSGYLSTHVAMMDNMQVRNLTGTAILCHTIGGLMAGIAANWIYKLVVLIFAI